MRQMQRKEVCVSERTIEATDFNRVCLTLLKIMERDQQPITVTKDGQPYVVLRPIRQEQTPDSACES